MFLSEKSLVDAYERYLAARGILTRREVGVGGGFAADLVSPTTVWEGKLCLDRDHLYQALGQGICYRQRLRLPKLAIFGLLPEGGKAKQAHSVARFLRETHRNVWVLFVDTDPGFIQFCIKNQLLESSTHAFALAQQKR